MQDWVDQTNQFLATTDVRFLKTKEESLMNRPLKRLRRNMIFAAFFNFLGAVTFALAAIDLKQFEPNFRDFDLLVTVFNAEHLNGFYNNT